VRGKPFKGKVRQVEQLFEVLWGGHIPAAQASEEKSHRRVGGYGKSEV